MKFQEVTLFAYGKRDKKYKLTFIRNGYRGVTVYADGTQIGFCHATTRTGYGDFLFPILSEIYGTVSNCPKLSNSEVSEYMDLCCMIGDEV